MLALMASADVKKNDASSLPDCFCQLHAIDCSLQSPITLPDKTAIVLGRSPDTRIQDKRCSRQQLQLTADLTSKEVIVKNLGTNSSTAGGKALKKNESYIIGPGACVEVIEGHHKYFVFFGQREDKSRDDIELLGEMTCVDMVTNACLSPDHEIDSNSIDNPLNSYKTVDTASCHSSGQLVQKKLKSFFGIQDLASQKSDIDLTLTWKQTRSILIGVTKGRKGSSRVAAFDIDGTIIITRGGRKFSVDASDCMIQFSTIPRKLQELVEDDYTVVFFTNQLGIKKGRVSVTDFKAKIQSVVNDVNVPVVILAACDVDINRKPCTGMWDHFCQYYNDGIEVDKLSSLYVGDAAGRVKNWAHNKPKDFSCSDRKFAANISIPFHTPEEFFLRSNKAQFSWGEFRPMDIDPLSLLEPKDTSITTDHQEMALFIGAPGSGKTSFYHRHFKPKGYVHINRDKLGSNGKLQKCIDECERAVEKGKRVVIDNTNPDRDIRRHYINIANFAKIPVKCFLFTPSIAHCKHNNRFRELKNIGNLSYKPVNDIAFNVYASRYNEPDKSEGFAEIIRVNFIPNFENAEDANLYSQYLL